MTITLAAKQLDGIRNNRSDSAEALIARVNEIGSWLASQKNSNKVFKLLHECHELADRLEGRTGKGRIAIQIG